MAWRVVLLELVGGEVVRFSFALFYAAIYSGVVVAVDILGLAKLLDLLQVVGLLLLKSIILVDIFAFMVLLEWELFAILNRFLAFDEGLGLFSKRKLVLIFVVDHLRSPVVDVSSLGNHSSVVALFIIVLLFVLNIFVAVVPLCVLNFSLLSL